ncbi:TRAP transporter permease [Salibacterium aidingense]|uniref:TRAP transporter permease n=1 Tax=Salibacterium aidingense TaxID=384933 RepID=UPI003BBC5973
MKNQEGSVDHKPESNDAEQVNHREFKNHFIRNMWYINLALISIIGILYILKIHQLFGFSLYSAQYIGLFIGLILFAVYISIPASKSSPKDRVPWYDWILASAGLLIGLYILFYYPEIVMKLGVVGTEQFVTSVVAVLLILEAIRRILGYILLYIVLFFLAYGLFSSYLPGIFRGSEVPIKQLFSYLYLDPNSMLNLLNIAGTIALSFLLLGQILLHFRGADILNDYALSIFGRFRGGPAKGSIVGSSLVGTISGGPVTNVMLTGNVTIPLMKKNGYTSVQAGAVESVASTGGQLMPPVMGIAAFMIADNLGLPFAEVALAALIPAILFYVCLFYQVDFMAARNSLRGMSWEDMPSFYETLKKGWIILPVLASLVYLLFFIGYTPETAGLYSAGIAIIFLSLQKDMRKNMFRRFYNILIDTGKVLMDISVIIAAAGLIVGITGVTGLGFNMGYLLSGLADYGLLFLLIVCAIVSIILGMGMPSVAAYALVAVLVAPTIVELGVNPLSAHLFVFYFAIVSNFTPPVALASFAAAPIAKASPHLIAFQSMKLGVVAYIVPFIFVYAPDLLIRPGTVDTLYETILTIVTTFIGCYLLSMAMEGYLFQKINMIKRISVVFFAVCLFVPISIWDYSWTVNIVGFGLAVLFILTEWTISKKNEGKNDFNESEPIYKQ